jgi:hypothetical protein
MGKTNKTVEEKDGVILETTRTPIPLPQDPRPAAKRKSSFGYFYVITLFSAVVICIVIFAIVFNTYTTTTAAPGAQRTPGAASSASTPTPSQHTVTTVTTASHMTGVLKSVNTDEKSVTFLDSSSSKTHILRIAEGATYKDKYGTPIAFAELKPGDIVDLSLSTSNRITGLAKSETAWSLPMRKNVTIDMAKKTITVSSVTYEFDNSLQALWNGLPFDPSQVMGVDVVTIAGLDSKALVLFLEKSHGYVTLKGAENIVNGFVEIDTTKTISLSEIAGQIPLAEGQHKIVVRGDNIEPFGKDIEIGPSSDIVIDLKQATLKTGLLALRSNVTGYVAIVDGKPCLESEIPPLDYGTHTLRVEKDGFIPVDQTFLVSTPSTEIQVNLKPILKLGRIILSTIPENATVYVDSARVGESPVSIPIELGDHSLRVEMPGYTAITVPVLIDKTDEPFNRFEFKLQPKSDDDTEEPYPTERMFTEVPYIPIATPSPIPSMTPPTGFSTVPPAPTPYGAETPAENPSSSEAPEDAAETGEENPEAGQEPTDKIENIMELHDE